VDFDADSSDFDADSSARSFLIESTIADRGVVHRGGFRCVQPVWKLQIPRSDPAVRFPRDFGEDSLVLRHGLGRVPLRALTSASSLRWVDIVGNIP